MKPTALITGASSGIGRASAQMLVAKGYRVFDLSRTNKPMEGVEHIPCDITKPETIHAAMQQIQTQTHRIDLLLLCAGMGIAGAIEFTTDDEMQRQFNVNVFGTIRVLQAALPIMRTQEVQGSQRGRIVFISSMAAVFSIPFQSMYSASKAAINAYVFALVNELRPFHIKVSCVMPGDVHTNFVRTTDLTGSNIYTQMQPAIEQMIHDEANGLTSQAVAKKVMKACTARHPQLFYTSDFLSDLECLAQRLLPHSFQAWVVSKMYKG